MIAGHGAVLLYCLIRTDIVVHHIECLCVHDYCMICLYSSVFPYIRYNRSVRMNSCIHVHIYTNMCLHVYVYARIYACMYACIFECALCMYLCMYACMFLGIKARYFFLFNYFHYLLFNKYLGSYKHYFENYDH